MVTYFNKKDLVEFGEYLLSDKRMESIAAGFQSEEIDGMSLKEKQQQVYHADVVNFMESKNKGSVRVLINGEDLKNVVNVKFLENGKDSCF